MPDDFERKRWQEEQEQLERAAEKPRDKEVKAKARKAKAAKRKVQRLAAELTQKEDLTQWEAEFTQSLSERLDEFGSAFADPEKGGRGEPLSYGQKAIVRQLKKKAKGEGLKRSGFKSKASKFTPRVRQLDESFDDEDAPAPPPRDPNVIERPKPGKPFLRIVKND